MKVCRAPEELLRVELDLLDRELDVRVLDKARKIVIHEWEHHVNLATVVVRLVT